MSPEYWAAKVIGVQEIIVKYQERKGAEGGYKDGRKRAGRTKKMKITHLEQSLLNYSPHILSPFGYVRVELVQIRGER